MKKTLTLILFCSLAVVHSFAQTNDEIKLKDEAKSAFYAIFETYRTNNCDSLVSYFNDSIIFINVPKDTILKTADIIDTNRFCNKSFDRINKKLDKETHQKYYDVKIFTTKEFSVFKDRTAIKDSSVMNLSSDTQMALMFLAFKAHRFDENDVFITGIEQKNKDDFYNKTENGWSKKKNLEYEIGWFKLYFFVLRKTKNGWKFKATST